MPFIAPGADDNTETQELPPFVVLKINPNPFISSPTTKPVSCEVKKQEFK